MNKQFLFGLALCALPFAGNSQCSTTTATTCVCASNGSSNCDLLPDLIVGRPPLLVGGNNGIIEYSQSGNGVEDGRLRISVSTPNIGHGPLEVHSTNRYICGTDTFVGTAPTTCPNTGLPPKNLVVQRVYHKNGSTMTYTDRDAGSMTYHPSHGHMHVDDWGLYTLRTMTNDPNPLNWPIIGTGAKLAFCLMDYGTCSTYGGHCVDSLGNTLLNNNFPNFGLGGGAFNCSPTVQGISSGWTDIYYQYLDGMYIQIPPGTCNGQYYIVVQIDPYNYFLEENENNNVIVVPYTLTQQVVAGTASITPSATGVICAGTTVTLSANSGPGYAYLWSTGATTQSVNVTTAGIYTVTVTTSCGAAVSPPYTVSFTGTTPVTTGATRCGPGSGTLNATANGATINWFAAQSGGSSLGTGQSFITPSANSTTSWYAQATTTVAGFSGYNTPHANTIGGGGYYTSSQYLIFDVFQNCTLASVKVYASVATTTTVELRNSSGTLLLSQPATLPSGESRITLNFPLTVGTDYQLTRSGSASLWRNNAGVAFPYTLSPFVSIKNTSAGTGVYYFFYDWEVTTPSINCVSPRVPATLTINPVPTINVSGNNVICAGSSTTLTASGAGAGSYSWSPGTGLSGTTTASVVAGPAVTTTYTVTGTNTFGCTGTKTVTVTVNQPPAVTLSPLATVCDTIPSFALTGGLPAGGSYSGPGVTNNMFSPATAGPGTHTIVYAYTDGFGCTGSASATITVNNCTCVVPATPGSVSGQTKPCPGSTYTYSVTNVAGLTYNWTPPANASVVTGQGTHSVTVAFASGYTTGSLCVTAGNACGLSPSRCKTITRNIPATPGTVQGNTGGYCQSAVSLTVPAVVGATSYTWTLPAGTTYLSGQGTTTVNFSTNAGFISGSVCVTATNVCMTGNARCTTIYATPNNPVISGPSTVCANQQGVAFSVTPVFSATSYVWGKPSSATIATGQGTANITVNFGATAGNITCQAWNTCGKRGTASKAVSFNCRLADDETIGLFPNPASESVHLAIRAEKSGRAVVTILDLAGRVIEEQLLNVSEGENIFNMDISHYSKGSYMMRVLRDGTLSRMNFIVN